MNRLPKCFLFVPALIILGCVVPFVATGRSVTASSAAQQTTSSAAVFEMKYRGLSTPDDPLSYHSYWGFGGSGHEQDPFVLAVKSQVQECTPVYNSSLPNAKWSVVEIKDGKPIALHFDVDGDGKPSENERFGPATPRKRFSYPYCFITPDFVIRTQDGREVPFRVMLVGAQYGSQPVMYMWSPCCVLEGQAVLDGEPTWLILYANGFTGAFTSFGGCSFALIPAEYKPDGLVGRSTLSSLINHNRHFYRLKSSGAHEKGKTLRVIMEKDTSPTGHVAMRLATQDADKSRLTSATLRGVTDTTVHFHVADTRTPLPVMRYRLSSAYIQYGVESDDQWRVNFSDGPEFTIEAGRTAEIDLGSPMLSVRAIDERDRYRTDVKERTTFDNKTTIYLTPQIQGKAGELYTRFSEKSRGTGSYADVKPHYTIVDSDGKQMASGDLEYG